MYTSPFYNDESGSITLLFALQLFVITGLLAFVVDLGWANFTKESAQAAAESAVVAGVQAAVDRMMGGGTYTCGSNGLGCQPPTACPAALNIPTTNNLENGCMYAAANGYTDGGQNGRQTVTIEADTSSPAPTVAGLHVMYWATTRITQQTPLTFAAIFGGQFSTVAVRATGAVIQMPLDNCLMALNPNANNALSLNGNASLRLNCGIAVDSNSATAMSVTGNITLDASSVQVVGGVSTQGNVLINPAPTTGVPVISDPLQNTPAPSFNPTVCDFTNTKFVGNGTQVLGPGTYCGGITISGNQNLTFSSGTYVFLGGGISASGNVTLTGYNVTFYDTFNNTHPYAPIAISGNVITDLTATTSGPLSGMLFFQDRLAPAGAQSWVGNSSQKLTGALYFPRSRFTYTGNSAGSGHNIAIIADTVSLVGNASFQVDPLNGPGTPRQLRAVLIE
jgi:hypothetical protein